MKGSANGWNARARVAVLSAGLLAMTAPTGMAMAQDERGRGEPASLSACGEPRGVAVGAIVVPWTVDLDTDGVVIGHHLTLRRGASEVTLQTGPRGFAVPLSGERLLVGERSESGTSLQLLDTARGCREWARNVDAILYPEDRPALDGRLRMTRHEAGTRRFEGTLLLDTENGASQAMIDGECSTSCEANDGDVLPADYGPAAAARPVPAFPAGGWPPGTTLPYTWRAGNVPPAWAQGPIDAAADDAKATSHARSPKFPRKGNATQTIRYTGAFPSFCSAGIACASRSMPSSWTIWLRPHGTDFSWGRLRWCQKVSDFPCFDVRRVMLHEFGHIAGLTHPSSGGYNLDAADSIMQGITPARPKPGSARHAFGRCDVATLQRLYGTPTATTPYSTCAQLDTSLRLEASATSVARGTSVKLKAWLSVADRQAYGRVAGDPLADRMVRLKYRRAGGGDDWTTAWMKPTGTAGRYELSIAPAAAWEFRAAFPSPDGEGLRFSNSEIVKVNVK